MSAEAYAWACDQDLPTAEKFVLLMLADNGGSDATREFSTAWLCDRCGLDPVQVPEILSALALFDLLTVERRYNSPEGDVEYRVRLNYTPSSGGRGPSWRNTRPGYVYVMKGGHGPMKVGVSVSLAQRAQNIGYAVGIAVECVWSRPCDMGTARNIEREILKHFASRRLKGEWLNVDAGELIAVAEAIASKHGVTG